MSEHDDTERLRLLAIAEGSLADALFRSTYRAGEIRRLALTAILEPIVFRPALLLPRMWAPV